MKILLYPRSARAANIAKARQLQSRRQAQSLRARISHLGRLAAKAQERFGEGNPLSAMYARRARPLQRRLDKFGTYKKAKGKEDG